MLLVLLQGNFQVSILTHLEPHLLTYAVNVVLLSLQCVDYDKHLYNVAVQNLVYE